MTKPISYLIILTKHGHDKGELAVTLFNAAGMGRCLLGIGDNNNHHLYNELWLVRRGRNTKEVVLAALHAAPIVQKVQVMVLQFPVDHTTLEVVREMLQNIGIDSSAITDEQWQLYLEENWHGKKRFYIDFDYTAYVQPIKMFIKRLEEHPHFQPHWLVAIEMDEDENDPDKVFTLDDFEYEEITFMEEIEDEEEEEDDDDDDDPQIPPSPEHSGGK